MNRPIDGDVARIVVVDDSRSIRMFLEKALQGGGHQVLTAESGKQALPLIERGQVDVVLTDIYMPEGDGLELLMEIRRRAVRPAIIAMSSTTLGPKNMLQVAQKMGARIILPKPFDAGQLLAAVEKALAPVSAVATPAAV